MHLFLFDQLIWNRFIQAFCWMLVHSLWQGLLVTVMCGVVIMFTKTYSALSRYNILVILFFLFLLGCACTFILEYLGVSPAYNSYRPGIVDTSIPSSILTAFALQRLLALFTSYCSANASIVVIIWFIIFVVKVSVTVRSIQYGQHLRNYKIHAADSFWQNKIASLCLKLQIKKQVVLMESALVKIPVVLGHFKPMILVPIGVFINLPAAQVEAVLLHELAHVRRNDYLVNFLQNITETVFFFNPALLWVSSLLKEERENCCDDVAINHTKNKKQFLEALISFKEQAVNTPTYAAAFPGKKNNLLHRFTRIITNKNRHLDFSETLLLSLSLVFCTILFVAVTSHDYTNTAGNPLKLYTEDSLIAPLKTADNNLKEYSYKDFSTDSIEAALTGKKKQGNFSKAQKMVLKLKNDKKGVNNVKTNPEVFAGNTEQPIKSGSLYEIEKMELDKKQQAALIRKQAELYALQDIMNRKQWQIQKENARVLQDDRKAAMIREKSRLDQQQVLKEAQEAFFRKQRAEKNETRTQQNY